MKLIKIAFLLSLFVLMIMMVLVWAFKKPNTNNKCIIVIDGGQYDVSVFRNLHLGGDVFACGTDMSTIFHQQHSDRFLNQMQGYKI